MAKGKTHVSMNCKAGPKIVTGNWPNREAQEIVVSNELTLVNQKLGHASRRKTLKIISTPLIITAGRYSAHHQATVAPCSRTAITIATMLIATRPPDVGLSPLSPAI